MDSRDSNTGNTLSLIVHELRSPASVVSGYLRLLLQLDVDRLTDQQRRMLEQTAGACGRLLQIIQELGDLAGLESGSPVGAPLGVPVFSLCEHVVKSAGHAREGPVPIFTCAAADRSAVVNGDSESLKRAFGALIAATAREHGAEPLECHGFVSDDHGSPYAVMAVGRQGLAAKREDIVANRGTLDRWRGGMGLSVPIACRIIEAHGGSVWAPVSAESRGGSAWSLPIAAPASPKRRLPRSARAGR
jgi:signal transduction histidine kinase